MPDKILILGAGAVGLVYGKQLSEGGAEVYFFIREKYRDAMMEGSVLYDIKRDRRLSEPIRFRDYGLCTSFEEAGKTAWDQVIITFSSTGLRAFDWPGFKAALTGEPTIVMLQPSAEDFGVLAQTFNTEQIVEGMITLISYHAPLETETADPPGTAYWFPPMMPTPFSGSAVRRDAVIRAFRKGNVKSSATKSVRKEALYPSAFLATFLTALESSDWEFKKMRNDSGLLRELSSAIAEVFNALQSKHGVRPPAGINLINSPFVFKLLLLLAPVVMPMDIETYFKAHFTKVGDQTRLYMQTYLEIAKKAGTGHDHLSSLLSR